MYIHPRAAPLIGAVESTSQPSAPAASVSTSATTTLVFEAPTFTPTPSSLPSFSMPETKPLVASHNAIPELPVVESSKFIASKIPTPEALPASSNISQPISHSAAPIQTFTTDDADDVMEEIVDAEPSDESDSES